MRKSTVKLTFKTTQEKFGVEYETTDSIIYRDVLGYTFEYVEEYESENKMCIVLRMPKDGRATWACEEIISIENLDDEF